MKLKALLVITAMLLAWRLPAPAAENKEAARAIPGWGSVIDPDGDCKIEQAGGAVKVTVPGKGHDLYPPDSRMNAPRVLAPVTGDFTVQVKVSADFDPGRAPAEGINRAFHGAGLLIWQDELNYFRFERGELFRRGDGAHLYFAPTLQLRRAGTYHDLGPPVRGQPVFTEPATYFRVQRKGDRMSAWYSRDGKDWQIAREFESFAGAAIQVGVCAVNTAAKEFAVTFDEFRVTKE